MSETPADKPDDWFAGMPLFGDMAKAIELFGMEPVMTWKLKPLNPVGSCITILGVAALAALYPAVKAAAVVVHHTLRSASTGRPRAAFTAG